MNLHDPSGPDHGRPIQSGDATAIVTTSVGPRIIFYGFTGADNQFAVYKDHFEQNSIKEFRSYGGHRLWVAPETPEMTYEPDNHPPEINDSGEAVIATSGSDGTAKIKKSIELSALSAVNGFQIIHTITNQTDVAIELAPWALTVMSPGGMAVVPLPEHKEHPQALLPATQIALWHYTNMNDPRFQWGKHIITLRQDPSLGPTKFGAFVRQGWAAHIKDETIFVKTFAAQPNQNYPDFGCNFESFTRQDMLELESLGPLKHLEPNESATHVERWGLFANPNLSLQDEKGLFEHLQSLATQVEKI